MPCFDPDIDDCDRSGLAESRSAIAGLMQEKEKIEAILCGVIRANPSAFNNVNWVEVGVEAYEAWNWWVDHQAKDKLRLDNVAKEAAIKEAREREQLAYLKEKYEDPKT